jgi:hypothetical protein
MFGDYRRWNRDYNIINSDAISKSDDFCKKSFP